MSNDRAREHHLANCDCFCHDKTKEPCSEYACWPSWEQPSLPPPKPPVPMLRNPP